MAHPSPSSEPTRHHQQLVHIAGTTPWLMQALTTVRMLGLDAWCIGAGAVRNVVWDRIHGRAGPSALADVDVAFFDGADTSAARDQALEQRLCTLDATLPWEVTNQAGVHLWFEGYFGHPVEPLGSLEAAVASWPEYATAVGLWLDADGAIQVIAPHGLDDLFGMVVRRNPVRVSVETYRQRIAQKRYLERWPQVRVIPS